MGTKAVLKWLLLAGVVVAGVAGALAFSNDILTWILIIVGVLVGLFYMDSADVVNLGILYLVLAATAGSLTQVIAVGSYLTGFFTGVVAFLGPVVLAVAAANLYKRLMAK